MSPRRSYDLVLRRTLSVKHGRAFAPGRTAETTFSARDATSPRERLQQTSRPLCKRVKAPGFPSTKGGTYFQKLHGAHIKHARRNLTSWRLFDSGSSGGYGRKYRETQAVDTSSSR